MKLFYQWAQRDAQPLIQIDALDWANIASRAEPAPGQLGGTNNAIGWINDVIIQGLHFNGSDHVAIRPLVVGGEVGIQATNIWDDSIDYPPGERRARICTFLPLAPDPLLGGAINTRIAQVVYAEGARYNRLLLNPPAGVIVLPWAGFIYPSNNITRHQVLLSDERYAEHLVASRSFGNDPLTWGWRDWAEHLPDSEVNILPDGRRILKDQRPQGRYRPSEHTLTWYQRDTNLAQGWITATHEDSLLGTAGAGETESVTTNADFVRGWAFATPTNEPNSADWPDEVYRCQLDCTAASAGLTYELADSLYGPHRIASDLATVLERANVWNSTFSGTGLKLSSSTGTFAAGNTGDRFGFPITATGDFHADAITLRFSADAWADGPWPSADDTTTRLIDLQRSINQPILTPVAVISY